MTMNNKYSNYKIAWFPNKLKALFNNTVTAPIYVRIKPTNRCCHNCYFCVYNYSFSKMHDNMKRTDEISINKMMEILEDLKKIRVKAVTYSGGGEPLVHKNIFKILEKTLECNIDLSILTNGQNLHENIAEILTRAKWIRISMDYWNKDLFTQSRNVPSDKFNQIIKNIIDFSKIKNNCNLGVNYIITKENHETLIEAYDFISSLGIDNIRFSPLWIPNFYPYHSYIKDKVEQQLNYIYSNTLIDTFDSYKIFPLANKRTYKKCYFSQIVPVIGADLNIYTCHNKAYDPTGLIGSIRNNKFSDIWFSEKTKKFFQDFRTDILCNHQCANDQKNKIIDEILNSYGDNYV